MTKLSKKLLAFSTSVILASTALMAGCGKVEGDLDEEKKTISENVTSVFNTVNNASDTIVSAMNGETDTAYSADITISIGEDIAKQSGMQDIKDVTLSADTKIKNGNAQVTIEAEYGSDTLATFDMVREKETGNIYVSIPELTAASLLIPQEYLETMPEDMMMSNMNPMGSLDDMVDVETDATISFEGQELIDADQMLTAPEFDEEELNALFEEIVKIVEENMPQQVDAGTKSGEVGDVEYKFDKKTLTITSEDIEKTAVAVFEELKANETFLSMIDTYGAAEGMTKDEFIGQIEAAIDGMEEQPLEQSSMTFDIYYQGEDVSGIAFTFNDTSSCEMFYYVEDNECCMKVDMTNSADVSGNLLMELTAETDGYETDLWAQAVTADSKMVFEVADFKVVDEESGAFKGTMTLDVIDEATQQSFTYKVVSDSTASKTDIEMSLFEGKNEVITIGFVGEETTASDVKIPSGQVFDASDEAQLEAFAATVDVEGFQTKLMDILGEDLGMSEDMMMGMGSMDMGGLTEDDLADIYDMYGDMDMSMYEDLM